MFQPRVPLNPLPTGDVVPVIHPTAIVQPHAMIPQQHTGACSCQHTPAPAPVPVAPARSGVQITTGGVIALALGGTGVVLVIGAVLVSMFLAVAITGASLAICALVIRSLLNTQPTPARRR
ncbi:SpdD-like protein [Streptomyces sp. NPDC050738]|uniref:SpdD-like protein n=1 Tax=Streptomyces sp. NPDC050738 TaxID=3154744 RepID=UPI0034316E55